MLFVERLCLNRAGSFAALFASCSVLLARSGSPHVSRELLNLSLTTANDVSMGVGEVDEILTLLGAFINTAGSVTPVDSNDQILKLCVPLTSIMVNFRVVILEKASYASLIVMP